MTRTAFTPSAPSGHGPWSDPTTKGGSPEAPATVTPQHETDVATITTRYGQDVIVSSAGDVVVDLAQKDPAELGCVVDLAFREVPAAGISSVTGHRSQCRIGGVAPLSPSWPSFIPLADAFGTTDVIDAQDGATP